MGKTYVIHWTSKSNGRVGTGTTLFGKEEADHLVEELNRDYPDIQHEVVDAPTAPAHDSLESVSANHASVS
jgi:MinD superfamily P-loop ATPase